MTAGRAHPVEPGQESTMQPASNPNPPVAHDLQHSADALRHELAQAVDTHAAMDADSLRADGMRQQLDAVARQHHADVDALRQKLAHAPGHAADIAPRLADRETSFNLAYLQLQMQMQRENRAYTTLSNILKKQHETLKSIIDNLK